MVGTTRTPFAAAHTVGQGLVARGKGHVQAAFRFALICSSTSFALAGIGVPGP